MALANPMPTYPWHLAPAGMATKRQLRKQGLSPGDQPIAAQVVWRHRGPDGAKRRVAYLYRDRPRRSGQADDARHVGVPQQDDAGPPHVPKLRERQVVLHQHAAR